MRGFRVRRTGPGEDRRPKNFGKGFRLPARLLVRGKRFRRSASYPQDWGWKDNDARVGRRGMARFQQRRLASTRAAPMQRLRLRYQNKLTDSASLSAADGDGDVPTGNAGSASCNAGGAVIRDAFVFR